jgi:hypothetical protein
MAQSENIVGGHQAGRDVTVTNVSGGPETFMARLHKKFEAERTNSREFRAIIDTLQYYQSAVDREPIGLEKKLELGNRQLNIPEALRAKELFVKCMARHSLSAAAQEVIAYSLAQINQLFKARVMPLISQGVPPHQVDSALIEQVIQPVLGQLEANFLGLMPHELEGMVYYLTANCFLDWHAKGTDAHLSPSA